MNTPICDFIKKYAGSDALRLHMPGHKGKALTGPEPYDITEIFGADSLYEASGIIRQSEENAQHLFGSAKTLYSTEGSSQCIRAMLYLVLLHAREKGERPLILAARNAHKTFVVAAGLLDIDVEWIMPNGKESYLSCRIDTEELDGLLRRLSPTALYITSPDYLGNCADISAISAVCRRHGVLLLVDNAHGAYLKFLSLSRHPLDEGADICCDSAHKTLPALTGAAYLHVSRSAPKQMREAARDALSMFGSTSPSYLILRSLDAVNAYLDDGYAERLRDFSASAEKLKTSLCSLGYTLVGDEPMKLTLATKPYGYTGNEMGRILADRGVMCEFCDDDFLVLMLSCELGEESLLRLENILSSIERRTPINIAPPTSYLPTRVMSVREAILSKRERISVFEAEGRILATFNIACPPAVPIAVCGERIDGEIIKRFAYYGIESCDVVC